MLEDLNPTDLNALLSLANQLFRAAGNAPEKIAQPLFLARLMESAVDIYRAGPAGEEAQRTAVQVALARLLQELGVSA